MNLNYSKIKKEQDSSANPWTSYSDLFMVLSAVFLFLFVVANLRTGASKIQNDLQIQASQNEIQNLRDQLVIYEQLTGNAENDPNVQKTYDELINRVELLETEAKAERNELDKQARMARMKHAALNRYQQLVKTVVGANQIAKVTLDEKQTQIKKLAKTVRAKKTEISQKEKEIAQKEQELQSHAEMIQQKAQEAEQARQTAEQERLKKRKLAKAYREKVSRVAAEREQARLEAEQFKAQSATLQSSYESEKSKRQLTERFAARQIQAMNQKVLETAQSKAAAEAAHRAKEAAFQSEKQNLESQKKNLEGEYQKARAAADARKNLASRIKQGFAKAGINADVDAKTGDVTVHFGDEYFDTGRSDLKPGMQNVIRKMIPIYAQSLFHDAKIAKKVSNVEIIGFASPTYKGRFVDPQSLDPAGRSAVDYNMDLSYQRAKSIFSYLFDTRRITYTNQDKLLPLVKVTGRSYLASDALKDAERSPAGKSPAGMTMNEFCKAYDCKKSQKVLIRFNIGD